MRISILCALGLAATSSFAADHPRFLRYPDVRGNTVVFTYANDLWKADLRTGIGQRLTSDLGFEGKARISPDGSQVAFVASYDGPAELYVMPLSGGTPRRLTFDSDGETPTGWTADGRIAYASSSGSYISRQSRLWLVGPGGGIPERIVLDEFAMGTFLPDGRLAYNRTASFAINWRGYRGGFQGKISLYDFKSNRYSELTTGPENNWFPMAVGSSLYYLSDRSKDTANLFRRDLGGSKETQLTTYSNYDIKNPSTDGKTIVYERDGELHAYDIDSGRDTIPELQLSTDEQPTKRYLVKAGEKIEDFDLSPDGKHVAVVARGDVFVISTATGQAKNLTSSVSRERCPRWSGDGKTVFYFSDSSGEYQLMSRVPSESQAKVWTRHHGATLDSIYPSPDGQAVAVLTQDARAILVRGPEAKEEELFRMKYGASVSLDWSPDGKWIAYDTALPSALNAIYLYELATGRATQLSSGLFDDRKPVFDRNGRYLYFTSTRSFDPTAGRFTESLKVEKADQVFVVPLHSDARNPLVPSDEDPPKESASGIDLQGIGSRAIVLPVPATDVIALLPAKDGVLIFASDKLVRFDLTSKKPTTIYDSDGLNFSYNAAADKVVYYNSGTLGVVPGGGAFTTGQGKVDTGGVQVWVDPREEWKQIFWETWRFERDNFYRADMGGVDWDAVGKHYASLVPAINHRADLTFLQRLLVSELGTSHTYVDEPAPAPFPAERNLRPSFLGVDYSAEGNWVRLKRVLAGTLTDDSLRGPLGEPGVKAASGNYLLAIDGVPVSANAHPGQLLLGKAGRSVMLTLNDRPSTEGSWTATVRPIPSETALRYYEWVEGNRRLVDQLSGGRIAYVHYPNTAEAGQREFLRTYYGQSDKEALILDGRFNGGGKPQPMVLQELQHRQQTHFIARNYEQHTDIPAINGPKAMLINGYAGSGGDLTPYMFKEAGMGKLIGMPTYGALVGIFGAYLNPVDGGEVSAPSYARFDLKTGEQIAENQGVKPDIKVDARPDLLAEGHDPQIEAAVKQLLAELAKQPKKAFKPKYIPGVGERGKG